MKEGEDFLPYSSKDFEVQATTEKLPAVGDQIRLRKLVKKSEGNWPARLQGILVGKPGSAVGAVEIDAPIVAPSGSALETKPATELANSVPEPTAYRPPERSLPWMLLSAFLGGLILNIMPCVLPVIALKVLSFVNQSKESPARVRKQGLLYGLGALMVFLSYVFYIIPLGAGWFIFPPLAILLAVYFRRAGNTAR